MVYANIRNVTLQQFKILSISNKLGSNIVENFGIIIYILCTRLFLLQIQYKILC